jgi:polyisoprenoid-binding protein YceI
MTNQLQYFIDPKASQFTVHAFTSGLVAIVAHSPTFAIRDFVGDVRFIPETLAEASLQMKIKVSSLEIIDEVSHQHRREIERIMFDEVMDLRAYPEIAFKSTAINTTKVTENRYSAMVSGNLSMHGSTKDHSFLAQVVMGTDTIRTVGEFKVKLTNYGIKIPSFPGGAMRDDLKLAFYILAQRKR